MSLSNDIDNLFPYPTARKGQKEVIEAIIRKKEEGFKFFILEAPTGFGKSAVAKTIVDYFKIKKGLGSYLTCSTKLLQDQYLEDINKLNNYGVDYKVMKGKSNYPCVFFTNEKEGMVNCAEYECPTPFNVLRDEIGSEELNELCRDEYGKSFNECKYSEKKELLESEDVEEILIHILDTICPNSLKESLSFLDKTYDCEYKKAFNEFIQSDVGIINYDLFLSHPVLPYRDVMICDEAHNIESKIMNRVGLSINEKFLKKFNISFDDDYKRCDDFETWFDYIRNDVYPKLLYSVELERSSKDKKTQRNVKKGLDLLKKLEDFEKKTYNNRKYVPYFVVLEKSKDNFKVQFKPLNIANYTDMLFTGNYHVLMSGTIFDKGNFCKCLGLDADDVYYYKLPSSFNFKKNSPLYYTPAGSMNFKNKMGTLPKMYHRIEDVLDEHYGENGIIHCHSKVNAKLVYDNVDTDRFLIYEPHEKYDVLREFEEDTTGKVVLGYSLEEGVNLPYDNISFQILMKAPYPSLADPQIKARSKIDSNWYLLESLKSFVQAYGRGMRAEDDYCSNYILDSSIYRLIKSPFCPKYVKNSVVYEN